MDRADLQRIADAIGPMGATVDLGSIDNRMLDALVTLGAETTRWGRTLREDTVIATLQIGAVTFRAQGIKPAVAS